MWAGDIMHTRAPPAVQLGRAKKCLDHAGTILFLHLVATSCFSGFPRSVSW